MSRQRILVFVVFVAVIIVGVCIGIGSIVSALLEEFDL